MSVFQGVYSPEVNSSALRSTAERATQTLNEFSDTYDSRIILAEWEIARAGNGPALRLRLKYDSDEITAVFQPSDLVGDRGWTEMSRTYDRFLKTRIRRLLDSLKPSNGDDPTSAEDD